MKNKYSKVTFAQVRKTCIENRFFPYVSILDKIFAPPAIRLTWFFLRMGFSAFYVSWISAAFVIVGSFGLASNNHYLILAGSFGYICFFLMDYVDGGVARYSGTAGMSGQYVDWIIHIIAAVATMSGLFAGALISSDTWIIPFGILGIVASALNTGRFSMGWYALCMERQQRRAKSKDLRLPSDFRYLPNSRSLFYNLIRKSSTFLFHENYAIFLLPLLAFANLFLPDNLPDFRVVMVTLSGSLYFLVMFLEIKRIYTDREIDEAYRKMFFDEANPVLPKDHFF